MSPGELFHQMGFMAWPLSFCLLAVAGLGLFSAARVFRHGARADLQTKVWIDAILFWGGFAVLSGVLGTLVGVVIASQYIEAAGAISTSLVWGGIKVALLTSVFGVLILGLAALLWFVLQMRWRLLTAEGMGGSAA